MAEADLNPSELTFEGAIAQTQEILAQCQQGNLSEAELETAIAQLVSTEAGARGFFVTYLSDPQSPADRSNSAIVRGLRSAPDVVADLLVKNLAMSAAMAMTHRRNGNEEMAQGSDRVRSRATLLIQDLQSPQIAARARNLHESTVTGEGDYHAFLKRWGYDAEQRQEIQQAIEAVMVHSPEESTEEGSNDATT